VVAVFAIENKGARVSRGALDRLSDYLAERLAASGAYQVVPRDQIRQRLGKERRQSYRDCYAQSCQIEIGKELAASKSLAAQLMKIGRGCVLTVALYDLRTAATERGATARGACTEDALVTLVDRAVAELTGRASASAAPVLGGSPAPPRTGAPDVAGSLTRNQVQATMGTARRPVQLCYDRYKVPGLVNVHITIEPHGMISAAYVRGIFANAPTGACVLAAVRKVVFPPFSGERLDIDYPFVLR
jgi:hypothetical protein